VLGRLGHIPKLKETVEIDGMKLRVEAMDGLRIARVSLIPSQRKPGPDNAAPDPASPTQV
jgi:CBS domain containing-hemolysin-like protein